MPLRMLNMIVEVIEDVVNKKQKARLHEVAQAMGEQFRETMLADMGNSRLKQAVLGLITKLRFENNLLNKNKDGANHYLAAVLGGKNEVNPLGQEEDSEEAFDNLINKAQGSFRQRKDGSFAVKKSMNGDSTIGLEKQAKRQPSM